MSYSHYLCLIVHSGSQHILCCVSFLFVFVLCFVYGGVQHILCYLLLCLSSSCVAYVSNFSGLSIFDCPFGIL
jgi:hypothetical protein